MVQLPNIEPFEWTTKQIPSHVLDLYGVGMDNAGRIVSPHYSPDMQLLAYHTRTPGQRDFRMHGSNSPVGLHTLGGNKELIICEGHSDTYSAKTMFPGCDVIGIPGSDTVNTLTPYLSRLRKYKRITVMTDGDAAGRKCGDALVELLPKSKTYRTHLAEGMDVGDYLVNGRQEDLQLLHKLATANKSGRFVTHEDCDKYANSRVYDTISTGISGLDDMMGGGIGVAELTLLCGYTGIGKSAFSQQVAVNAAKSGTKVMYVAGEMTPKQNLDRLVRQWYGGIIRKEDLAAHYKTVSDSILITKFSDLTLNNVTDTVHEGVLDHGVRLVIIDVLSDVEGFLNTDMTHPARIIKAIHKASLGDEQDDVPPCAILAVAHTKGNDEGQLRADDIRGGSVIRQEATCIIGIAEEKQGDMSNRNRVLTLLKRPRNRDHEPDPCTITYDTVSLRYTDTGDTHATKDSKNLRQFTRREVSSSTSSSEVPPSDSIPVGCSTQAGTVRTTDELTTQSGTDVSVDATSVTVSSGLLLSTDGYVHRDERNTTDRGPHEITAGSNDASVNPIHVSSTDDTTQQHGAVTESTQLTEPSSEDGKLNALRRMYEATPRLLLKHRTTTYKTNDIIRRNLVTLGYELL